MTPFCSTESTTPPGRGGHSAGEPVPTSKPTNFDPLALVAGEHDRRRRSFGAGAAVADRDLAPYDDNDRPPRKGE